MARYGWLSVFALAATPASAATLEVAPGDDLAAAINAAQPGDEVVLAGGEYTLEARLGIDVAGTSSAPIIIRAAEGQRPHLHRPASNQNIIDIDGASWVEIRGIEFSGGSAGVRISAAEHLTIADCEIHDSGDVALRANDGGAFYDSLHIVRNHIHHTNDTGEGMYLGCNDDGCRVANSVIERNYVHHTNQPSVDQGDGIELKEGSYANVIRDNVIHDTRYPCILTYSATDNGAANVIERNVMWNCGDHGIQSAADTVIRNNIVLSAGQDGIAMQPHQSGDPRNLIVAHNTVLQAGNDALSLRGVVGEVLIANNALYAEVGRAIFVGGGDLSMLTVAGNVGQGGVSGAEGAGGYVDGDLAADFIDANFGGAPPVDVFPAAGGGLAGGGDPAHVVEDDFNATRRADVADVGAYAFDPDGNPGWALAEAFKEFPEEDGDATGVDGSGGASGADETGGDEGSGEADGGGTVGPGGGEAATGASAGAEGSGSGCGCRVRGPSRCAEVALLLLVVGSWRRRGARCSSAC